MVCHRAEYSLPRGEAFCVCLLSVFCSFLLCAIDPTASNTLFCSLTTGFNFSAPQAQTQSFSYDPSAFDQSAYATPTPGLGYALPSAGNSASDQAGYDRSEQAYTGSAYETPRSGSYGNPSSNGQGGTGAGYGQSGYGQSGGYGQQGGYDQSSRGAYYSY